VTDISRRKLISTGLAAAAGITSLGVAAGLAKKYGLLPPDCGGIWGVGETLNYASYRLLTNHSMAREFARSEIYRPTGRRNFPSSRINHDRTQTIDPLAVSPRAVNPAGGAA